MLRFYLWRSNTSQQEERRRCSGNLLSKFLLRPERHEWRLFEIISNLICKIIDKRSDNQCKAAMAQENMLLQSGNQNRITPEALQGLKNNSLWSHVAPSLLGRCPLVSIAFILTTEKENYVHCFERTEMKACMRLWRAPEDTHFVTNRNSHQISGTS